MEVERKPIVVKTGTELLTDRENKVGNNLNEKSFSFIGNEISELTDMGKNISLVTSAAISAGMARLNWAIRPSNRNIEKLQMLASVGNPIIINKWDKSIPNYATGEILLTKDIIHRPADAENVKLTIKEMFDNRIIPVINENDAISYDEIKFGDNDNLALTLSSLINADWLVILTNVDGIYSDFENRKGLIKKIYPDDDFDRLLKFTKNGTSSSGSGGMTSKLNTLRSAQQNGINVCIANGQEEFAIRRAIAGEIGTLALAN